MTKRTKRLPVLVCLLLSGSEIASTWAQSGAPPEGGNWRTAALKQYDRDRDGRLSDAERETMRKEVFAERRRSTGRRGGMMFPPEIVAKYDKDGDGSLNDTEARAAQEGLTKMFQNLQKKYDANGNGNFEPSEIEKLQADAAAGKLEDVPRFFIQMLGSQGRRPRSGGPPSSGQQMDLRQFDKNGDGRLNEEELRAARAGQERSRETNGRIRPGR
jgi:Ca2+-binding EF-hand superfamily protein